MHDAHLVAIANGVNDRADGIGGFLLRIVLLLYDPVEELAASHEFEDQVEAVALVEDLKEFDNIGMIKLRKNVDL